MHFMQRKIYKKPKKRRKKLSTKFTIEVLNVQSIGSFTPSQQTNYCCLVYFVLPMLKSALKQYYHSIGLLDL